MNLAERGVQPPVVPVLPKTDRQIAAELNPIYTSPQYHRYPRPSPDRYVTELTKKDGSRIKALNGEQVLKDYGQVVGEVVHSAVNIYNEIQSLEDLKATQEGLTEQEILIQGATLGAKQSHFSDLCTIVSDQIDIRELITSLQIENLTVLEQSMEPRYE